jgi:hypothetical protein
MVFAQTTDGYSQPSATRRGLGVGLSVAVAVGVGVGALTAYGQGWLRAATASLTNSAGPWSAAAFGGVLLGEGLYGWSTVADTTDWRYWALEAAIGVLVISYAAARGQRPIHIAPAVAGGVLTAAVVFGFGRLA